MNSTWGKAVARGQAARLLLGILLVSLSIVRAMGAEDPMPRPPQLERDVQFWIRVYSQIDTNAGFLHDQYNLAVVYDTLHFAPYTPPHERERLVEEAKARYAAALRRIAAANGAGLSPEDQRIRDMWGSEGTPARLLEATDDIRFQLGQSDRFRAGLIRSGAWETHIAETLANLGLPAELAVLPHVESSFNPAAYSKVGAAGLWQFMRSTGRRYLRIDSAVDDRLDPFRSTQAAAQLLAYNYRLLGTWPLALTAYNHGAEGVRRAKESLGTDDIVRIVRNYKGRTFGFASRNFYVSFLAALAIDRDPEKYFGPVERAGEAKFQEVVVPAFVPVNALERILRISEQKLRELNPALLRSVWNGQRHVPKAYHLRLPLDAQKWSSEELAQRLAPGELYAGQPQPRRYRVRAGDTIASLAEQTGVSAEALARLNRIRTSANLRVGRTITLPASLSTTLVAANTNAVPSAARSTARSVAKASETAAAARSARTVVASIPVNAPPTRIAAANIAGTPTPAVARVAASAGVVASAAAPVESAGTAHSAPVASAASGTAGHQNPAAAGLYIVQQGESLGEIAAKVGMSESQLLTVNGIRNRDFIFEGQQLLVLPAAQPTLAGAGLLASLPPGITGAPVLPTTNRPTAEALSGAASVPSPLPAVAGGAVPAAVAERESAEEAAAVATARGPAENAQPVSAAQAEELSPALGPSADPQQNADPIDYSVAKDNTIRVAAAETLGHYADWLGLSAARIRQLNRMKFGRPVLIGHRIKLAFAQVSREEFEARRRTYHQELQASYFAAHRIVGTEVYIVRRGDNLWTVTQRFAQLPIWLLQQYNPDVDLADLHPGTQVVMPRVEDVVAGPA
ncbi:MAG TPA: LysM peptidoglycan-binding domain-containing protein [Steroidobacteraceae bacterium]